MIEFMPFLFSSKLVSY
uniref:Uncharacterized protein n=1 Tax=Arundo donax TaxID=35708 RepID=A0A0A8YB26_ARUDO